MILLLLSKMLQSLFNLLVGAFFYSDTLLWIYTVHPHILYIKVHHAGIPTLSKRFKSVIFRSLVPTLSQSQLVVTVKC